MGRKNSINLRDQKSVHELMKILYGIGEAKDGTKICNTVGEPRAEGSSEVVEPTPYTKALLLQEPQ